MAKKQEYGNESITSLKGADRVRKRPAVIFGSDGVEGCAHSIFEIVSNSIDEARDGHGDTINVTRCKDGSVIVEDFGRGMPVDWNNGEGRYNWELLFCEMYAGGKYGEGEDNYEFSLGLNGLGLCATQYASAWMTADIYRDGYHYHLDFKKGENVGGLQKEPYKGRRTGSIIHWKPDDEVFTDIDVPGSYYKDVLRRQAVVNKGITFRFRNQVGGKFETEEFCYADGIRQYIEELVGDNAFTMPVYWEAERRGRDAENRPEMKLKITASFCFSKQISHIEYYHNSSWLEYGGSPDKAVRSGFTAAFDKYLRDNNKYTKNENKIIFQDIQDSLVLVTNCFSTQTSYENQTKKAITNKFIQEATTEFFKHQLEIYFIENKLDADKICDQVLVNMRARIRAETTKLNIKSKLQSSNDMGSRVQKFVDCRSKDVAERELFIVEGDSALGACKQARDSSFQAIIPVRGKILNCLKAEYNKIFANDIITDLIKVLGCGVETKSKAMKDMVAFNIDQLRWNKVIICTDADVDGFQIRTLILAMIYRLMPKLIENGKVYIAESPLYEINSKDETWFAYNEQEKQDILSQFENAKFTIQRSKGLGENDADMMSLTTMNPATRRLIRVDPTDAQQTAEMFDLWLGDNLAGRKEHIARDGAAYIDMADVS